MIDFNRYCRDCVYNIKNECRRNPPVIVEYSDAKYSVYPPLDFWTKSCAEFRAAD